VLVARRVERDGSFYAGPFLPARFARKTMALTHRLFGIRSCNEIITGKRDRPCLEYDIKRCIAPCVDTLCTAEEYGRAVDMTQMFFEGRNDELAKSLRTRMLNAAEHERFEEAAELRDAMRTVQTLGERQQKMATTELGNRDAFGLKIGVSGAVVQVFQVRGGRVVERVELGADTPIAGANESDVLEAAIEQFYELRIAPPDVYVPAPPAEQDALESWLSERAGRKVRLVVPQRGEKRGLVDLANRNAELAYQRRFNQAAAAQYEALNTLQAVLALPTLPRRIECFDISTIQGSETVASMVVCEDGRMKHSEYRKFRIRGQGSGTRGLGVRSPKSNAHLGSGAQTLTPSPQPLAPAPDDFAAMEEVVRRRYRKMLEEGGPFPDLILIDGGKGQLTAAYSALQDLGLANLIAVGIAKKEELLFTRDRDQPIAFAVNDPALLLLQQIRDEAHRFAVTFHRKARSMRDLHSALDDVPGVGPRRRRTLLTKFGSLAGVRRATREELAATVGRKVADAVLAFFASQT
jgi:excinuclease ABC subunit C